MTPKFADSYEVVTVEVPQTYRESRIKCKICDAVNTNQHAAHSHYMSVHCAVESIEMGSCTLVRFDTKEAVDSWVHWHSTYLPDHSPGWYILEGGTPSNITSLQAWVTNEVALIQQRLQDFDEIKRRTGWVAEWVLEEEEKNEIREG